MNNERVISTFDITVVRQSRAKALGIGLRFYCPALKGGVIEDTR